MHTEPINPVAARFFLARQPVLDREQNLAGHELLFRSAGTATAATAGDLSDSGVALQYVAEIGAEKMSGSLLGFVDVDPDVLQSDFVLFLPNKNIVLAIPESLRASGEVIDRIIELRREGFQFALDDSIVNAEDSQKFLPLVDIVRIDVKAASEGYRSDMLRNNSPSDSLRMYKAAQKKLLARKVDEAGQFEFCRNLGFDYFQGYFFATPVLHSERKISSSELLIIEILSLISTEADNAAIERCIKKDASIGLNLLRMANTPGIGATQRIGSLKQALQILGRRQLQQWLQMMLYQKPGNTANASPLLLLATTRGKLLELLTEHLKPGNRNMADIGFMVGIMSLMDTLFGLPMEEILTKITVFNEVSHALLHRKGFYGDLLRLVENIERLDKSSALLAPVLLQLRLSMEDLHRLELSTFVWVDQIIHGGK